MEGSSVNRFLAALLLAFATATMIPPAEAQGDARGHGAHSSAGHGHGGHSGPRAPGAGGSLRCSAGRVGHPHSIRGFQPGRHAVVKTPRYRSALRKRGFTTPASRSFLIDESGERALSTTARAIDGDTFYLGGVRYRVQGIDTPEKGQPGYESAKRRLQQLLDSGAVTVERKAVDKYGRTVAIVRVHGQDVAQILQNEGFAKPEYLAHVRM